MKTNKIFIVCIFLLAILTLGAVSASQDVDNLAAVNDGGGDSDTIEAPANDVDTILSDGNFTDVDDDLNDSNSTGGDDGLDDWNTTGGDDGLDDSNSTGGDDEDTRSEVDCEVYIPSFVRTGGLSEDESGEDEPFSIYWSCDTYDVSGKYYILIDNQTVSTSELSEGYGYYFPLRNLDLSYGIHTAEFRYEGDYNYRPFSKIEEFEYNYYRVVAPEEVVLGDYESNIRCSFAIDASGELLVLIDDEEFYRCSVQEKLYDEDTGYVSSYFYIDLSELSFGEHTYKIVYTDGDYDDFTEEGSFNVSDYLFDISNFQINYDEDIYYGDEISFEISLPSDITGNILVVANGENYTISADEREGSCFYFYYDSLLMGDNEFTFTYESEKYPKKSVTLVGHVISEINVPYEFYYGIAENEQITLMLPADAKGKLSVYRKFEGNAGDLIKTVDLTNGKAALSLSDLSLGEHDIIVRYDGDDYEVKEYDGSIYVYPNVICPTGIYINSNSTNSVRVISPSDATENLTVSIYYAEDWGGGYYEIGEFKEEIYCGEASGIRTVDLPDLPIGIYYLKVSYNNGRDKNYFIRVSDNDPNWKIELDIGNKVKSRYDNIFNYHPSNIPPHAEGKFTLYIDGIQKAVCILDEFNDWTEVYYDDLSYGPHTWKLTYSNDNYYLPTSINGTFNITFVSLPEVITGDYNVEVYIDDGRQGNVDLYLNGEKYASSKLNEEGYAYFSLDDLPMYENYTYEFVIQGDDDHELLTQSGTFYKTYMFYASFAENELDSAYSHSYDFFIELPDDATGSVSVEINNRTYNAIVENGRVVVQFSDLNAYTSYDVVVSYSGDKNYRAGEKAVTVNILGYNIIYETLEDSDIVSAIELSMPEDIEGNLTVNINGELYQTVQLENGFARIELGDLQLGYYYIDSHYSGDYESDDEDVLSNNKFFSILPEIKMNNYLYVGEDCEITILLPNATGQVEVYLDDGLYGTYDVVDGVMHAVISNLTIGDYSIKFSYLGDEYYHLFASCYDPYDEYGLTDFVDFYVSVEEEECDPMDYVDIQFIEDDDENLIFDVGENVVVGYLLVPATGEFEDSVAYVTISKNGQALKTISSSDLEGAFLSSREAYKYPIAVNFTQFENYDLLGISVECLYYKDTWEFGLEFAGDNVIMHECSLEDEFYVFYGNITKKDLDNPELMGPHPDGRFFSIAFPDSYNITDGTIVISDGDSVIRSYSLSDCEAKYEYSILGKVYSVSLNDFDLMTLPENKFITFTFNYANNTTAFKRIRIGDYIYKVLTPDDFRVMSWSNYKFQIAGEETNRILAKDDDAVVIFGNSNMQSAYIDFGGGYFTVYVNGTKVENLGALLYQAWKNSDAYVAEYDYPSDWGSELNLVRLRGGSVALDEFHLSLADLGITKAGTYNIKITHYPSVSSELAGDDDEAEKYIYITETELLSEDIIYDPDYAHAEIGSEVKYRYDMPFLFTFEFGENMLSLSNRLVIYINDTLAYNTTTLVYNEGELEDIGQVLVGMLDCTSLFNKYGYFDEGTYSAAVYLIKDNNADPIEIGRGDFTVFKQKGNFTIEVAREDDNHTYVYVDIPEGNWEDYCLTINIADSEEIYPDYDNGNFFEWEDWFRQYFPGFNGYGWAGWISWYNEYCIFKDDNISLKAPLENLIGKGKVPIDLGILDEGTHLFVAFNYGREPFYGFEYDCYNEEFTIYSVPTSEILGGNIVFNYGESGLGNISLIGAKDITANVVGHPEAHIEYNDGVIRVSGLDAGNYSLNVTTIPDEGFAANSKTFEITVKKIDLSISAEASDVYVGNPATIVINTNLANIMLSVSYAGSNYAVVTGADGSANLKTSLLKAGSYNVTVSFAGDNNMNPKQASASFNVLKAIPTIAIVNGEAVEDSDLDVTVEIANATGIVNVNGKNIALADGKATTTFTDLIAGNMVINVIYYGDENYVGATESKTVTVKEKQNPEMTVSVENITVGQTAVVNIEINPNVTGKVTVDGNEVTITDGRGTFNISDLAFGNYTVTAVFEGDKYFKGDEKTATFNVNKLISTIVIINGDAVEGSDMDVIVEVEGATGTVNVNGGNLTLIAGRATTTFTDLIAGNMVVNVVYYGDEYYQTASVSKTIPVKEKQDAGLNVTAENIKYGQTAIVSIEINANVTGKVTVDGNEVEIIDGKATYAISDLNLGSYNVTVAFAGDKYFKPSEKTVSFNVTKPDSAISIEDFVFDYGSSASKIATLTGASNFTVEGDVVPVINGNTVTVSGLDAGVYSLRFTTVPYENYNAVTKTVKVTVNKLNTVLTSAKVTTTYGTSKKLSVVLKDANNNHLAKRKITVSINNKIYTATTSDKGVATIAVLSNLAVKTYTATIKFAGEKNYNAKSATQKVVVNKATPKLTASSKNFKVSVKTKKFSVILKTDKKKAMKKVKVYIKVNGVTYSAYTASNGKAILKITKLTKAKTYTAKVTFKGNSKYKAVSKNVKIKVYK